MNPCVSAYSEHFPQPSSHSHYTLHIPLLQFFISLPHTDLLHVSEHALVALTLAGPLVEVAPAVVPGTWAGITPSVTFTLCTTPESLQAVFKQIVTILKFCCKYRSMQNIHRRTVVRFKITHGKVKISNNHVSVTTAS